MRKAGILLPIFSLPSKYGIGSLGSEAYNFVDFLVRTGQTVWQVLPVTSIGKDDYYSPYKTNGAFSGNYDLVDIDKLVENRLIEQSFIDCIDMTKYMSDPRYVDYDKVRELKQILFKEAFKNFKVLTEDKDDKGLKQEKRNYDIFCKENKFWLDDYCQYMALKNINENIPYWKWTKTKNDEPNFNEIVDYHKFLQYKFFNQWYELKQYANDKGVQIFGDIPIYISQDSSDFYYHRDMFLTDKDKEPSSIAGVPPDEFSDRGQCWGNPLYDWKYLKKTDYDWWIKRIEKSFEIYDILRIDHFRGFESFYSIDKNTEDAMNGKWIKGPGKDFFDVLFKRIPDANIVAEDLGIITDEVRELLDYTGFPGMKVVQFGFNSDSDNFNLPHKFYKNTVSYTGTHDNKTLLEWLETTFDGQREYAMKYLRLDSYQRYTEGFIRAVMGSCSDLAIVPIQDWLYFGSFSRINTPSTTDNNWKFRLLKEDINEGLVRYISEITGIYGRYHSSDF